MSGEVPERWSVKPLGEIADLIMGQSPPSSAVAETGDGLPFIQGNAEFGARHPTPRFIASTTPKVVREGDVLISVRAPVGEVNIAEGPLCIGRGVGGIRAKDCDPDFLFYAVGGLSQTFARLSQGSTFDAINGKELRSIEILLPPLDEQQRIAAVLRSASTCDEAALQVVEKYGDVIQTEIDAVVVDLIADPSVPVVRLGDVAAVKGGKRLPKGSEYSDAPTGYRYVRVTDWNDHEIDPSHVRWISGEAASAIKRYTISSADLFISIAGSIGLVASIPSELDGAFLTENAAKIVLDEDIEIDRDYLLLVMRSGSLTDQIRQQKGVGGGVPKLALFRIEALEIPLPSLKRQREIAALYRSLKIARSNATRASKSVISLREMLASDLLSGRVRVPA